MRSTLCIAAASSILTAISVSVSAAPLEPAACEQLRQELSTLEKSGARINLAKGTGWAMANLKPDQLRQIEQLIDDDAQFLFRCPQPKKQFDSTTEALMEHGTGSDPDPDAPKADGTAVKAVPKRKSAAQSAAAPPAAQTVAPAVPKPAAKPKSKPADAFVAPEPTTKAAGAAPPKQSAPQ